MKKFIVIIVSLVGLGALSCTVESGGEQSPVFAGAGIDILDDGTGRTVNVSDAVPLVTDCQAGEVVQRDADGWTCTTVSGSGAETDPSVNILGKADLSSCVDGDVVVLDPVEGWICAAASGTTETDPTVNDLGKLDLSSCAADDVVVFDGTNWDCAAPIAGAETDPTVNELGKLDLSSCAADDVVVYDGTDWDCAAPIAGAETDPTVNALGKAILAGCAADDVVVFDGTTWDCAALSVPSETDPSVNALGRTDLSTCAEGNVAALQSGSWACAAPITSGDIDARVATALANDATITGLLADVSALLGQVSALDLRIWELENPLYFKDTFSTDYGTLMSQSFAAEFPATSQWWVGPLAVNVSSGAIRTGSGSTSLSVPVNTPQSAQGPIRLRFVANMGSLPTAASPDDDAVKVGLGMMAAEDIGVKLLWEMAGASVVIRVNDTDMSLNTVSTTTGDLYVELMFTSSTQTVDVATGGYASETGTIVGSGSTNSTANLWSMELMISITDAMGTPNLVKEVELRRFK